MNCENPSCHCQSEVGVIRDGREVCSEYCKPRSANESDLCMCGHAGCESAEAVNRVQPDFLPA